MFFPPCLLWWGEYRRCGRCVAVYIQVFLPHDCLWENQWHVKVFDVGRVGGDIMFVTDIGGWDVWVAMPTASAAGLALGEDNEAGLQRAVVKFRQKGRRKKNRKTRWSGFFIHSLIVFNLKNWCLYYQLDYIVCFPLRERATNVIWGSSSFLFDVVDVLED